MTVDPNLSLQVRQANVAPGINQAAQLDQQNALNTQQTTKVRYDNLNERDRQRVQSTVFGAAQLKPYLDRNDLEGAQSFLTRRREVLQQRMGGGENVDTAETDHLLSQLRNGNVQGLQTDVSAILAAGQAYNMLGTGNGAPSNVQEWQYYNNLPAGDQAKYIEMKRSNQLINTGDATKVVGAGGNVVKTFNTNLKPEDQPKNAEAKAEASARGATVGKADGEAATKLADMQSQMPRLMQVTAELSALGKTATYTGAGVAANSVTRQLGADVRQGAVDRTAYISKIDNEILPLLRQTFGAAFTEKEGERLKATLGDADKSPPERDAILASFIQQKTGEVESLIRRGGGATPAQGATVKVSNGKETFMISPEDLAGAQGDGFKQVQ